MRQSAPSVSTLQEAHMPLGLGAPELIIVLIVVMLIFGAGKLPEVGSGLGKGIREFKESVTGRSVEKEKTSEHTGSLDSSGKIAHRYSRAAKVSLPPLAGCLREEKQGSPLGWIAVISAARRLSHLSV